MDEHERPPGAPDGDVGGPESPARATRRAMAKVAHARAVVLVEGISDQIAVETAAVCRHRDLAGEGVVVLPVGGVHAMSGYLERLGPTGEDLTLAGLCDAKEEDLLRQGLRKAGVGAPGTRKAMADIGFHVCVEDLEDELIRAAGVDRIESLLDRHGDGGSFRTFQKQPDWRGREVDAQIRRFLGSGARRKLRYARFIVEDLDADDLPRPLAGVLAHI